MEIEQTPFTIHNLPYGIISTTQDPKRRCASAFQDFAIDLGVLAHDGLFADISGVTQSIFAQETLNSFASLPIATRRQVRTKLTDLVQTTGSTDLAKHAAFIAMSEVQVHYPMDTHNFADFFCSIEHTDNCAKIAGLNISKNWYSAPLGYNGRTSSLVASGAPVVRPCGIFASSAGSEPKFQPETSFDFELEMGVFISASIPRGERLDIKDARDAIFGLVLLNDWSARKIQLMEMSPLGPFHSKGSATSISPWVVPIEALEAAACPRSYEQLPAPLPHLDWKDAANATFDIELSVQILRDGKSYTMGEANLNELHWSPFQQLTHLASAGEGLSPGDILGTGTVSSSRTNDAGEKIGLGCLFERKLESCKLSSAPADIAETFLQDGDEVIFEGWAMKPSTREKLFGFGQCRGKVSPAVAP